MPIKETKLKQSIGAQIKLLRGSAGLTQMELAVKLGTSPAHVSLWETGRNLPDSKHLENICNHFGVELLFSKKQ